MNLEDLKTIYKDRIFLKAAETMSKGSAFGMCRAISSSLLERHLDPDYRVRTICNDLLREYMHPGSRRGAFWWPVKGDKDYRPEHTERRIYCLILMHHIVGDLIKEQKGSK